MWSRGLAGNWSSSSSRRRVERYAEIPQEAGRTFFVDLAGGDGKNESVEIGIGRFDLVAVFEKEHTGGYDRDPLVAVDECVVAGKTKR